MSLRPGTRVGSCEVVSSLGEGGMGEVYRARDTKLGRDVALKVLPAAFAADPDRRARFEREAQVLASLNHPHIGAIYGIEDGALVLELVEGPTLADRIAQGPLPIDEAIAIARQMADALEAAHDRGIIHRDLKPANIKLTSTGRVKVLDFGLAKLTGPAEAGHHDAGLSLSPTLTSPALLTGAGMILGTAAYMSPEQARGRPADARADIWAYGCVLYEMLTGRPPFAPGETVSDAVAAVLTREPDWHALPAATPSSIRRLLRRCLDKDPSRRLRHAADARLELDDAATPPDGAPASTRWQWALPAAIGIAVLALIAAAAAIVLRPDAAPSSAAVKRFYIDAPAGATALRSVALSRDGSVMAMAGVAERGQAIWVRPLESADARLLVSGLQQPADLFWSPDARAIGFFDGGQLKAVTVATGEVRTIAAAPNSLGGTWGADGTILFAANAAGGIFRVHERGGPVTAVTTLDPSRRETSHRWPQFLPDGRHFIYTGWSAATSGADGTIQVASLDAPAGAVLTATTSSGAVYADAGYLLYVVDGPPRLVALPFDAAARTVTGAPLTIAQDAYYYWESGRLALTTAADGTLVYLNNRDEYAQPAWYDRSGRVLGTVGDLGKYYDPAISPDGQSFVVEKADPNTNAGDLWKVDIASGAFSRVTHEPSYDNTAVWSPDGRSLAFSSDRGGLSSVHMLTSGESAAAPSFFAPPGRMTYATDWSPDGRELLVMVNNEQRNFDIWAVPVADPAKARPVLQTGYQETRAMFAPNGRWIAYESNESGQPQVYVRSWPGLQEVRQVSVSGGAMPRWRGDSRELFFATAGGAIMAAPIAESGGRLQVGPVMALFDPGLNTPNSLRNAYTPSADGQRFLVLTPLVDRVNQRISVFVNWPALFAPRQ